MENIESVMGELYTIKAGLSVISCEAEKVNSIKQKIEENEKEQKKNEFYLNGTDKFIPNNVEKKNRAIKGIVAFSIKLAIKVLIALACFVIALVSAKNVINEITGGMEYFDTTTFATSILLATVLPIVGLIILLFPKLPPRFSTLRYCLKDLKEANEYINDRQEAKNNYLEIKNELEAENLKLEQQLNEQIRKSTPIVTTTYEYMISNCQNHIREFDFANVDLIIHSIYTGRADSVKEALLLTDQQLRYQEAISIFERESAAIRNSIDSGFASMSTAIHLGFSSLEKQLNKQHAQTMDKLSGINSSVQQANERMSDIANAQVVQNAYSANISKNSQKLAKDTNEILGYIRRNS
ncbi:MAG: hypothetical protein IJ437_00675 [Clostridia bacterium]|nr:hypothetical protein [Clostridia bacterium]